MDLSAKVTREQRCKGDEELVKYIWKMGEFQAEGTARERPTGRVRAGVLRISTELEGGGTKGAGGLTASSVSEMEAGTVLSGEA